MLLISIFLQKLSNNRWSLRPLIDFTYNPSRAQWALKSPFMRLERQNNSDTGPLPRDQRHTELIH